MLLGRVTNRLVECTKVYTNVVSDCMQLGYKSDHSNSTDQAPPAVPEGGADEQSSAGARACTKRKGPDQLTGSAARSAGRGGQAYKSHFCQEQAIEPAPAPAPALSINVPVLSAMRSGAQHTRSAAKYPGDLFSVLV